MPPATVEVMVREPAVRVVALVRVVPLVVQVVVPLVMPGEVVPADAVPHVPVQAVPVVQSVPPVESVPDVVVHMRAAMRVVQAKTPVMQT